MVEKIISPRFSIDTTGWKKIGKGALIAGVGAVLAYLTEAIPGVDLGMGTYGPVVVSVLSILVNVARKFFTEYKE